jgi:hypothetical protein
MVSLHCPSSPCHLITHEATAPYTIIIAIRAATPTTKHPDTDNPAAAWVSGLPASVVDGLESAPVELDEVEVVSAVSVVVLDLESVGAGNSASPSLSSVVVVVRLCRVAAPGGEDVLRVVVVVSSSLTVVPPEPPPPEPPPDPPLPEQVLPLRQQALAVQ